MEQNLNQPTKKKKKKRQYLMLVTTLEQGYLYVVPTCSWKGEANRSQVKKKKRKEKKKPYEIDEFMESKKSLGK